ncbi:MAG: type II toxin-antitoxin system Phd/YefM family antitoxin [Candidatus Dormibacteraceae bacterium]
MRIGVRELRQHASRYLARVKIGEVVEVTERGRLVARLVPAAPPDSAREQLIAQGRLVPATRPWRMPEPVPRAPGEPTSEEVLAELRQERP